MTTGPGTIGARRAAEIDARGKSDVTLSRAMRERLADEWVEARTWGGHVHAVCPSCAMALRPSGACDCTPSRTVAEVDELRAAQVARETRARVLASVGL